MATLYIRNVPDEVAAGLGELAAREGLSVSAFAVRELTEAAARAGNERLLGELPDHGVDAADLVQELDAGRAGR